MDAAHLNWALELAIGIVQDDLFGCAMRMIGEESPEALDETTKRLRRNRNDKNAWWSKDLRSLRRFRPCVDKKRLLRMEGILGNAPD